MVKRIEIQNFSGWESVDKSLTPISFQLEITARCNLNCRHCYVNRPAGDRTARKNELSLDTIDSIADQASDLGTLWCLITGGEPLLRPDFNDIFRKLKEKGFLINVFTNATLITQDKIELFKNYPPRDIEVTVYGATQETYEAVTRVPGSYIAFRRGLDLLLSNNLNVTLKAMAIKSNIHEMELISNFCRANTTRPYRFDPFLHLRYDGDPTRNKEIKSERLTPDEIVTLETSDSLRFESLQNGHDNLIFPKRFSYDDCVNVEQNNINLQSCRDFRRLFRCGILNGDYYINYKGMLSLCSALWAPELIFDLHTGTLSEGLSLLRDRIESLETKSESILRTCKSCKIVNLCMWCPATAYLETGDLEGEVPYFCQVAHARAAALEKAVKDKNS